MKGNGNGGGPPRDDAPPRVDIPAEYERALKLIREEGRDAANGEYYRRRHAMQAAVAVEIGAQYPRFPDPLRHALKHLRVGMNAEMSDFGALSWLLIQRGLIDPDELLAAQMAFAEQERVLNEHTAKRAMGADPDADISFI